MSNTLKKIVLLLAVATMTVVGPVLLAQTSAERRIPTFTRKSVSAPRSVLEQASVVSAESLVKVANRNRTQAGFLRRE